MRACTLEISHQQLITGSSAPARVKREADKLRVKGSPGQEMKVMARVEHSSPGFERERDDKDGPHHSEHGKRDAREDRAEDSRDE